MKKPDADTLRLATDLGSPSPRALFAALSKDFVISVAFFHGGRVPVRCITLRSAREANVARILALPTAPAADAVDAETAAAVARAVRRTFAQQRGKKPTVLSLLGSAELQYDEADESS